MILFFGIISFACNSNNTKKKKSTETYHQVGVPNVNGNIPDTTNAIDLTHKLDTMGKYKDSAKRK